MYYTEQNPCQNNISQYITPQHSSPAVLRISVKYTVSYQCIVSNGYFCYKNLENSMQFQEIITKKTASMHTCGKGAARNLVLPNFNIKPSVFPRQMRGTISDQPRSLAFHQSGYCSTAQCL